MQFGEVAKRSNAADCKSVAPAASEVRILPSPAFARAARHFRRELRLDQPPRNPGVWPESGARRQAKAVAAGSWSSALKRASRRTKADVERMRERLAGLPAVAASRRGGARSEPVGGSNSVVESQPSKLLVAGSIPVSRSRLRSLASPASFASAGQFAKSVAPKPRSGEGGPLRFRRGAPLARLLKADGLKAPSPPGQGSLGRCSSVGRARPW